MIINLKLDILRTYRNVLAQYGRHLLAKYAIIYLNQIFATSCIPNYNRIYYKWYLHLTSVG